MVGVGMVFAEANAGGSHGFRFGATELQLGVELDHEIAGAIVVNIPQTEDEGLCSGLEEAANEANQLVSGGDDV